MFKSALVLISSMFIGHAYGFAFEMNPLFFCLQPGNPLSNPGIASILNLTSSCVTFKEMTTNDELKTMSQMAVDLKFCQSCLQSDGGTIGEAFRNGKKEAQAFHPQTETEARERLSNFHEIVQQNNNALFYHASVLSESVKDLKLLDAYNPLNQKTEASVDNLWESRAKKYFKDTNINIDKEDFKQQLYNVDQRQLAQFLEPANDSCISFDEFLTLNQFPIENGFYSSLKDMKDFIPKEWDYEELKNELANLTAGKVVSPRDIYTLPNSLEKGQMLTLLGRIKFLHANPLYRNLFAQKTGDDVLDHQKQLFTAIKQSFAKIDVDRCSHEPKGCRNQAFYIKDDLRKNTAKVFQDEHALKFTMDQVSKNSTSVFENLIGDDYKLMRFSDVVRGKCSDPGTDLDRCIPAWGNYCHQLEVVKAGEGKSKNSVINMLDRDLAEIFEPGNKYFEDYKNKNCPGFDRQIEAACGNDKSITCRLNATTSYRRRILEQGGSDAKGFATLMTASGSVNPAAATPNRSFRQRMRDRLANFSTSEAAVPARFSTDGVVSPGSSSVATNPQKASGSSTQQAPTNLQKNFQQAMPPGGSLSSAFSSTVSSSDPESVTNFKVSDVKSRINEIDSEKEFLRSQLQDTQARLAQANENERRLQEERIKFLEQKDGQLTSELSFLKKQVSDLEKNKAQSEARRQPASVENESSAQRISRKKQKEFDLSDEGESFDESSPVEQVSNRSTAFNDGISTTSRRSTPSAASASVGTSNSNANAISRDAASVARLTTFNKVLLEKYGIQTKSSKEATLIVNQEDDGVKLGLLASKASGSELPLRVPADVYAGFENRNQTIIKRYEKFFNSSSEPVTKISVETDGKEPLEIYVIREQGKLVMQPVRKVTREALIQTLRQ